MEPIHYNRWESVSIPIEKYLPTPLHIDGLALLCVHAQCDAEILAMQSHKCIIGKMAKNSTVLPTARPIHTIVGVGYCCH